MHPVKTAPMFAVASVERVGLGEQAILARAWADVAVVVVVVVLLLLLMLLVMRGFPVHTPV